MAKAERRTGKRGETHYSGSKIGSGGKSASRRPDGEQKKPFHSEGSGEEGRKPYRERPRRQEDGDAKPYGERKPFRRGDDNGAKPFGEKKSHGDRKPFRKDNESGGKPYGERKPFRNADDGGKKAFGERKPFRRDDSSGGDDRRRSFEKREGGEKPYGERREWRGDDQRPQRNDSRDDSAGKRGERPSYKRRDESDNKFSGDRKPYQKRSESEGSGEKRPFRKEGGERPFQRRDAGDKPPFRKEGGDRPSQRRESGDKPPFRKEGGDRPYKRSDSGDKPAFRKRDDTRSFEKRERPDGSFRKRDGDDRQSDRKPKRRGFEREEFAENSSELKPGKRDESAKNNGPMTLNKYLAHSGISSRRDAAAIIKEGKVSVNGAVLTEPGYRVLPGDKIVMDGKELRPQRHFVYVLLNKPKDFITTTEDERGRRTVMELVAGATTDRLYPIGRLDRNTTGVLLLTNDGDLSQKLSHPKYESKKIYQVSLDKELTHRHFDQILEGGVMLEDGPATVDRIAYLDKKSEIGLEIHSGRNRIVRRIFEHLGYDVVRLDRVMYAGLTKKNVSRGKWRFLTEQEVVRIKHFHT